MTREVVRSYTDDEKATALAAYEQYGLRPAERLLAEVWGHSPNQSTMIAWKKAGAVEITDEHRDFWADHDRSRRTEVMQRVPDVFNGIMDVIQHQLEFPDNMERLSKIQGLSIAGGIWFDKVFPQQKAGFGGINIGDNAQITMNVIAPPTDERPAKRYIDVE